ncbi:glutamate formimidoyltransferase [Silvibacterium dinghuense]|uniref:glutamate formimidoyltransferase n=1 Tax=Silvibacterium dinghuense TaxID=1560006 RepID=A0A4Q1SE91_9BACT|nr:glutamate formimidoyltransferase [Silvibacterium dinghuense]RXS95415.1 glutamate formimidoyltransferase [Silvibacterium dinghuense]GGH13038.1 glutamate formiminotransferase [Silvibacterium dinghuense]
MPEPLIECVPNFSEGQRPKIVEAIVAAMQVEGVSLLDYSLDADHNRSVVTIVGPPAAVVESAVRGAGKAAQLIDLTQQEGVHPRIGAADVIPFVPVQGISLEQCVLFARQAGRQLWDRYGIPVYYYEAAAARPDRALLEDVRRGQFEGLRDTVRKETARQPDVGGPDLHPTAGASAVGARRFLIAYNLYLNTADVAKARAIAREIRASGGGLTGVKAMGVLAHGEAQISMNITDFRQTPVSEVYAAVRDKAARFGVEINRGELIGLIPEAAAEQESEWMRLFHEFDPEEKILERKLEHPRPWPGPTKGSRV